MSLFFALFLALSIVIFAISCYKTLGIVRHGLPENRFDNPGQRFSNMLKYGFGQKLLFREPYGNVHFVMFWSFLIFVVADIEMVLRGIFPVFTGISEKIPPIALLFDVAPAVTLLAVVIGLARRFFLPPANIKDRSNDVLKMLSVIIILILAFFWFRGALIASGRSLPDFLPVSRLFAGFMAGLSPESINFLASCFLSVPALALLFFAAYVPYNRHMHMVTAIPNSYFRSLEKPSVLPKEDFKAGSVFGAGDVTRLSWKDLLDTYSCTECGRCDAACPAANTGKQLSPKRLISSIQENLLANAADLKKGLKPSVPLIGEGKASVSEEAIWSCTTCAACVEQCPVSIEHLPKTVKMRRHLVQMEAKFPEELLGFFENMEQRSNPWGMAPSERTKWHANADVKTFEPDQTEYLFFVGCAGAFDSRARQVTIAFTKLLNAAGVSWGVLGNQEKCCGDSLRKLGNEYVFEQVVDENKKMFADKGVKKIVTHCPHCFNTLKNDYGLEVIHHSELISKLLKEGKLKFKSAAKPGKVVFHDPCYLGRHNGMYEQPREIIAIAAGEKPAEMGRSREKSFCCGAGGGRMWMEEYTGTRINRTRVKEALGEKPNLISVSCPYCLIMFEDGLKDEGAFNDVNVKDIAEIVAERI